MSAQQMHYNTSLSAYYLSYLSIYSLNILNALIRSLCLLLYSLLTAIYSLLYQHNIPYISTLYLINHL